MRGFKIIALVALLLGCLLGAVRTSGPAAAQASPITLGASVGVAEFPKGMTFSLSATSTSSIRSVELLYSAASLETLNLVPATFTPGTSIDAQAFVDLETNFWPAGLDILYHWRLVDDEGNESESPIQTVAWKDDRFKWKKIATPQVEVYAYNKNKAFNQRILDEAQSTIDRLQSEFDVTITNTIRVWVYDSKKDFSGTQAPNSQEWVGGTAYPDLQLILAVLPEGDLDEVGRIVPHEISHQVLHQAVRNPFNTVPVWFDEGLAVSNQANGNQDDQSIAERAFEEDRLFSIRSLNSDFPYDPAQATLAYAQSFSVVQYILRTYDDAGLASIIKAYQQGMSHDDVFRKALGVDLDALDANWRAWLSTDEAKNLAVGSTRQSSGTTNWPTFLGGGFLLILAASVVVLSKLFTALKARRNPPAPTESDVWLPAQW